ncbi:MAG: leucyl aminopeptidase, partial [Candidatus Margulisbacteria bacterium]|nr:leucyl aminopeptidase [Candidatus Margulisiibacteriota bacterium]
MKIITESTDPINVKSDLLITCIFKKTKKLSGVMSEIDKALNGVISKLIKNHQLTGEENELTLIHGHGALKSEHLLIIGLGDKKSFHSDTLRNAAGHAAKKAGKVHASTLHWILNEQVPQDNPSLIAQSIAEGTKMGSYTFTTYKTEDKSVKLNQIKKLVIIEKNKKKAAIIKKGLERGGVIGDSINLARSLANTPSNKLTPTHFVQEAKSLFKSDSHIKLSLIDKKKAASLGMEAFLGVAKGSAELPYMLILTYKGAGAEKPTILVGKGVTFDTGGISIKPSAKMGEMKADMSGAAAVLGTMLTVSKLKPKKNITAIMPLVENMPSGMAQKPGDVVTAMNGKTIEIINTDAEGRMILADALCFAVTLNPSEIFDIATLTGACSVALGDVAIGLMGNKQKLVDGFLKRQHDTGERLWQLPLYEEFLEYLKSDVADIKHCVENRLAGTCSAGKFLEQFVNDVPWAHLDIASVM